MIRTLIYGTWVVNMRCMWRSGCEQPARLSIAFTGNSFTHVCDHHFEELTMLVEVKEYHFPLRQEVVA